MEFLHRESGYLWVPSPALTGELTLRKAYTSHSLLNLRDGVLLLGLPVSD
jgi:hypothetical protein